MSNKPNLPRLVTGFDYTKVMTPPGEQIKLLSPNDDGQIDILSQATQNALFTIHNGLRGIGQMMVTMALEDGGNIHADITDDFTRMSRLTMMDIGGLIEELSDTAGVLSDQLQDIEDIKHRLTKEIH